MKPTFDREQEVLLAGRSLERHGHSSASAAGACSCRALRAPRPDSSAQAGVSSHPREHQHLPVLVGAGDRLAR